MWQWLLSWFNFKKSLNAARPPGASGDVTRVQYGNAPLLNDPNHRPLPPACGMLLIQQLEGYKNTAYQDQKGIWTIGFGHTHGVKESDTCTKQQAMAWLAEDTGPAWEAIQRLVKVPLTQNQGGALLSFIYNIGIEAFENSGVLRALNHGSMCDVPPEMRKWCKITINGLPTWNKGLAARRENEIGLFIGSKVDWRVA